jgi:hypothetical protein
MNGRRCFLRDLGRGTIAAGLAGVSSFLLSRRDRSGAGVNGQVERRDHTCVNHWICRTCARLPDCPLPQALSAREHGVKPGGGEKGGTDGTGRDVG